MASPTPNLGLTYPAHGGSVNAWDTPLNTDFDTIDLVFAGTQSFTGGTASFGTAFTLTQTQANNRRITISGTLTNNLVVTFPAIGGLWVIDNATTGAFAITVKVSGSAVTAITCYQGVKTIVSSNGTDMARGDDTYMLAIPYAGNPNGFVAGTAASANNPPSVVWDYTNSQIYFCTTTGVAAAAVWTKPTPSITSLITPNNLTLSIARTGGNLLSVAVKTSTGGTPAAGDSIICNFQTVSAGATTGGITSVTISAALSMDTNATGATLGSSNSVPFRIWVALFNNAGTAVLALMNASTSTSVKAVAEYGVASTTAVSGSATSAGVWYTPNGTSLSNCAYRLIGYCEYTSGLATAGTYTSDPSNVVVYGPGIKKPGDIVQTLYSQTGTSTSGTTALPFDNTIPQNTEGTEFMSASIAPSSKINLLSIETQGSFNNDLSGGAAGGIISMALFQDSTADALAAIWNSMSTASSIGISTPLHISYFMVANTVSSTTFKIRAGLNGGGATNDTSINGTAAGTQKFNGVCNSYIRITEIMG